MDAQNIPLIVITALWARRVSKVLQVNETGIYSLQFTRNTSVKVLLMIFCTRGILLVCHENKLYQIESGLQNIQLKRFLLHNQIYNSSTSTHAPCSPSPDQSSSAPLAGITELTINTPSYNNFTRQRKITSRRSIPHYTTKESIAHLAAVPGSGY